jgi:hypothetical protein
VGPDPDRQPLMLCRRGRSRPPPARFPRRPAAATQDLTAVAPWPPWLKLPTTSQISEAARCQRTTCETRPLPRHGCRGRSHQLPVGSSWSPAATRDLTAITPWSPWSKPPAAPWLPARGLVGGVNMGPGPPSYSSSSSYWPPWSTTTSSSSTAPYGLVTAATVGRWPQQRRDDGNSIALCAEAAMPAVVPRRRPVLRRRASAVQRREKERREDEK